MGPVPEATLSDYGPAFYRAEGVGVPGKRQGKFILVQRGGALALVLAARADCEFHANILHRYCERAGLRVQFNARGDAAVCHDPDVVMHGGGYFDLDEDAQTIELYGSSQAYGPFSRALIAPQLSGYRIVFR